MNKMPLIASLTAIAATAHFNTNAGSKFYICVTPKPDDLDAAAFALLTWVQVKGVGSFGETGSKTNILSYETWDDAVVQKAKGLTDGGSPEVELARDPDDPGQVAFRAAADTNFSYAFKIERNDKPNNDVDSKPTIRYNRGLVSGPTQPNGRNEDFDLEIFMLGLQQKQITVDPVDGTV